MVGGAEGGRVEGVGARISCVLNMDSSVNFGFGAKYRAPALHFTLSLLPVLMMQGNEHPMNAEEDTTVGVVDNHLAVNNEPEVRLEPRVSHYSDCGWLKPNLPPGDRAFPFGEMPSPRAMGALTGPPPSYDGRIRQLKIGNKNRILSVRCRILRMQNELYALMGELGRFHGGHELQRRVSALLWETSWAMGEDDDEDSDSDGDFPRYPNSNDVVSVKQLVSLKTVEPRFSLWHTVKNTNECREYLQGIFRYDGNFVDTGDLSKKWDSLGHQIASKGVALKKLVVEDERDFDNDDYGSFYHEMIGSNIKFLDLLRCEISDSDSLLALFGIQSIKHIYMERCMLWTPDSLRSDDCFVGVKRVTFRNCAFLGYALLHWVAWLDEIESVEYVTIEGTMMTENAKDYLRSVTKTLRLAIND